MRKVFISHPLTSSGSFERNRDIVDDICREIMEDGDLPISPIHAFAFIDEETPEIREAVMQWCLEIIPTCHALYSWSDQGGCSQEWEWARSAGVACVDMREGGENGQ